MDHTTILKSREIRESAVNCETKQAVVETASSCPRITSTEHKLICVYSLRRHLPGGAGCSRQ